MQGTKLTETLPYRDQSPESDRGLVEALYVWRRAGLPPRHMAKSMLRHTAAGPWGDAYRRLRDKLAAGPIIVLLGPRGTGKTQLAVCLMADLAMTLRRPLWYFKVAVLFEKLRDCYRPGGPSELELTRRVTTGAGLVLDELSVPSWSEWELRQLTTVIDGRYDRTLTTILISNQAPDEFARTIGPSILSRIREPGVGVVQECNWPSFRTPGEELDGGVSAN